MSTLPIPTSRLIPETDWIATERLRPNEFSVSIYGEPDTDLGGLLESVRTQGILVPLVVTWAGPRQWEVLSGHRRLACALALGLAEVPCHVVDVPEGPDRDQMVLDLNSQRQKTFSQMMREADALESLLSRVSQARRMSNLRQFRPDEPSSESRNSDTRGGRIDARIAKAIGLGGKDLYRQARTLWKTARQGDPRAQDGVRQIDLGRKTIHAAYKDLRRRDRFTTGFQPTPYDVWTFKHDRAYGVDHPGSIPAGIVAHTLHYFTNPGDLVVDPMAGGGTTLDVCLAMGRRCLAYDLSPVRPDIRKNDARAGLPPDAKGCQLVFLDPPYHTMLAEAYARLGAPTGSLVDWTQFLADLARLAFETLAPGGFVALLLANQTEKDLPRGLGYIDHGFLGYQAMTEAGLLPHRRISCPMSGHYLPQQVRKAREDGRLLGQVRDLIIARKPGIAANP